MKSNLFKMSALLLAMVMMLTLATGCGGGATSSDAAVSDDDGGFVMDSQDANADGLMEDDTTVSTAPNGGNGGSGNGGSGNGGSGNGGSQSSDNADVFKNIPKELKGKTVIFSDFGEAITAEYQKVIKQFTTDTGIRVKMMQFLNAEYITKVAQQIAAGKSPDIAVSNYWFPASLEMVQPLPSQFNLNDGFWDKRVAEALSVGGKYYFVNSLNTPISTGYMVYYNKKLFNTAGAKTPQEYYNEGQWSYENLLKAAKDMKTAGYEGAIIDPMVMAGQMGSSLIVYDHKKGEFSGTSTDPGLLSALQYYSKGHEEGMFYSALADVFATGGIGMSMMGTYSLKNDGSLKNMLPSDIGVVPLPTTYEGKKLEYFPAGLRGYGIAKGAQNVEGAYYLLRYFLDFDKYEPAGAYMFANKTLEKYYKETHLPLFTKSKMHFENYQNALQANELRWDSPNGMWKPVKTAASGQVTVELNKMRNLLNNAIAWANQKIKDFASR